MDSPIKNNQIVQNKQQSDEQEGKQLFDQLSMSEGNPFEDLELSSQIQISQQPQQNADNEDNQNFQDFREMMRKSKKQKKKQKKMKKTKAAKKRAQSKKQNKNINIQSSDKKPHKKMTFESQQQKNQSNHQEQKIELKNRKTFKKINKDSQNEQNDKSQEQVDSNEYSSEQNLSNDEDIEKKSSNHDVEQNNQGRQFKKRLGKKSRQRRILQKQGFDLKQLGNDADAQYELNQSMNDSDDSFSQSGKKKKGNKRVKKQKKQKLTNEQFLNKLKQLGCQQQVEQNQSARYNYDSGLEQLQKLRPKKQNKHTIKVQNKLFGNLQMQIQQQANQQQNHQQGAQDQIPLQKLQLQFKPKISSSKAGSFLNKVQTLKKHRGLQANVDQIQFQKFAKQKTKRSISQLVTKIQNQVEEDQQIDIQVKAPTIAKGKSADLINNTMFIVKSLSQKQSNTSNQPAGTQTNNNSINSKSINVEEKNNAQKTIQKSTTLITQSFNYQLKSKKGISRSQFYKQIRQSINVRRSKHVTTDELKNSMKSSKLQQLEDIRKKIEQKRRKDAMYELGQVQDDNAENVINDLQEQLARHQKMSKADYKRLLLSEQGIQGLGEYEDIEEKKKKKKNHQQQETIKVDHKQQKQINSESIQKEDQQNTKNIVENIQSKKDMTNFNQNEKIQKSQHSGHEDDMIEEYQGLQQKEVDQQMDLEQQNNYDEQADDQDDENQQDEQNQEDEQNEQEQSASNNKQKVNEQIQIIEQKNPQLQKQLQEQGIIMPGANNKRKQHTTRPEQIDLSKYIVPNQNGINPQITIDQKQTQKIKNKKESQKLNEQTLEFKQFKKLRKIAVVIQQKKKKRQEQLKRAKQFFQQQAELGSDNQQNDDNVKAINKKDDEQQQDGEDLDQQLEQLIDNAVDINEADEQQAFKKYMQDVKQKDREQLQRILRGDFRRVNHDMPEMNQMQQDERNRIQRMQKMVQWMKKRQQDEKDMYAKDESQQDDEMNYYYDYNGKKKKITDRKNRNKDQQEGNQTPQQNDEQIQKKLQYYLMDTISPAKRDTDIQINTQLITQLPTMGRKNTKSLISSSFGMKLDNGNKLNNINYNNEQKQKQVNKSNGLVFNGSLMNLAGNKNDKNSMSIPKMKKTSSHMSEYLNKNKSQQSKKGIVVNEGSVKLPSIFNRFAIKKK